MKAVILAGGLGSRLKPFTDIIPKPLLPLGEQALIEIQIETLKRFGFTEIYIATNYKANFIEAYIGNGEKYGVKVFYSKENQPLGTCGPLSLLKSHLTEPFMMMNGDILTKLDFNLFYQEAKSSKCDFSVATKIITTPFRFGNVCVDEKNHIVSLEEKPTLYFEILAGIYFFTPNIFRFIPEDTYFGIDDLIKKMLLSKENIHRYLIKEYWIDIGQVEDYSLAQKAYKDFVDA
jgi:NDP-sugar pyrophosphorylase family protein